MMTKSLTPKATFPNPSLFDVPCFSDEQTVSNQLLIFHLSNKNNRGVYFWCSKDGLTDTKHAVVSSHNFFKEVLC